MSGDEEPAPLSVLFALVAGVIGALPLLFVTAVAWSYAGDLAGGPVLAVVLLTLIAGQFAGVVLLRNRRSWRVLVGTSLAVVVVAPTALVATDEGSTESAAATVGALAVLVAGPALTALLASQPGPRRWGSPPRALAADHQPASGLEP